MSGEENKIIFHLSRGREHQIPCQERKRKSDAIEEEEDKIRFHVRRGSKHQIPFKKRKLKSDFI
jgi:hypothetical protein